MPQAAEKQRARWPGSIEEATAFLKNAGFTLTMHWEWLISKNHIITEREKDAIKYLCNEWDFGGLIINQTQEKT